jgi:hypothetical protein
MRALLYIKPCILFFIFFIIQTKRIKIKMRYILKNWMLTRAFAPQIHYRNSSRVLGVGKDWGQRLYQHKTSH